MISQKVIFSTTNKRMTFILFKIVLLYETLYILNTRWRCLKNSQVTSINVVDDLYQFLTQLFKAFQNGEQMICLIPAKSMHYPKNPCTQQKF